jgi:hypothetical protein
MTANKGPYAKVGKLVRKAREKKGWDRDDLIGLILCFETLDADEISAEMDICELEDDGTVLNTDVLKRILWLLDLTTPKVAKLMKEAEAAADAAFAEDLKRFAQVLAKDQNRSVEEVEAKLGHMAQVYQGRPMA